MCQQVLPIEGEAIVFALSLQRSSSPDTVTFRFRSHQTKACKGFLFKLHSNVCCIGIRRKSRGRYVRLFIFLVILKKAGLGVKAVAG